MDQIISFLICQKTDNVATKNSTDPFVATIEEKTVAYLALCIMAVVPIIVGSFRSIQTLKKQLLTSDHSQTMSTKDVAMFPFIASFALLSIYIVFKIFSKEYVNFLLTLYFFILGIAALTHVISPILYKIFHSFNCQTFSLQFTQRSDGERNSIIDFEFTYIDVFSLIISALFGSWYLWKKHWIANNVLGLAFSINGIEILQLNTVVNGCILLGGLFIYDIFWVFGTDVMVTVAKSFEAPIKLIFPQDFLLRGVFGTHFAMLGLGDIVVPGIFIALLLRYDYSLKRKSYFYFYTCLFSYIIGLTITVVVLTIFRHAQPALLYLVPCCILTPLTLALIRGDLKSMFAYKDTPTVVEEEKKNE